MNKLYQTKNKNGETVIITMAQAEELIKCGKKHINDFKAIINVEYT